MQNLKSLIGKLNDTCRNALEGAAGLCLSRTNYEVEVEHLLLKLMEASNTDIQKALDRFGVDASRLAKDLTRTIDGFKTGNARTPALSPRLPKLISDAWLICSVDYESSRIRSGYLLLALLSSPEFAALMRDSSKEIALISAETLGKDFEKIVAGSAEDKDRGAPPAEAGESRPGAASTKALDQFTIDLTDRARKGEIDPVVERDYEIRQMVDILTRRRQNNPILTGEAGVGKTAVVEGFALRIAQRDVPPPLQNVSVRVLDLGLLQAGAGIKGEFENRLKGVIQEVKASPQPIILFIDEAHTMIGAGGQAGQNDAANLLKPALARGELRTIAATTWSEYKKYFEKDAALARRFQVIKVDEPSPEQAVLMMRHLIPKLETHHGVRVLAEAVESAVHFSDRYITGRQLPDKAVSVLDTACARMAISQTAVPAEVEDLRRRLAHVSLQTEILHREHLTSQDKQEQLEELSKEREEVQLQLDETETRWETEKQLVDQIRGLRTQIETQVGAVQPAVVTADGQPDVSEETPPSLEDLRSELKKLTDELRSIQGEKPLLQAVVDSQIVADVISGWTGIPVGKMMRDEIETVLGLKERLGRRVLGQDHALEGITHRIQTSRARMEDPKRPIGVFLLVGPSGVGKTETALALADTLYGGERNLITINMSEYQEAHTVSSLKGSPPGYVGYGEGGVLTEAVRRKPYSVVLLDEVEKAHADVLELFFQVFDKGFMEDAEGRDIDFKNTVILLTSNVGTDAIMRLSADEETRPDPEKLVDCLRPELLKHFKPAFLGRLIVIPYYPIGDSVMRDIIRLQLGRIASRVRQNHRADFGYDDSLVEAIMSRCTEVDSGARNVDHILSRTVLPEMSREVLTRMAEGATLDRVRITSDPAGNFVYEVS
jgi:type VI secretion system protein VasG